MQISDESVVPELARIEFYLNYEENDAKPKSTICEDVSPVSNLERSQVFAKSFYTEILKDSKYNEKSFVFSPFSIQAAGALLYAGASGKTAEEMVKGFHFGSNNISQLGEMFQNSIAKSSAQQKLISIANKIYLQNGLSIAPNYKETAIKTFQSDVENINFSESTEAANTINRWVEEKTEDKIKNFISPDAFSADVRLLLLNAINFKGFWSKKFDKATKRDFYPTPDKVIEVDTMTVESTLNVAFGNDIGAKAIDIPFNNSDLSLFLVCPASKNESLDTLEIKLNTIDLKKNLFDSTDALKVKARIPKFKIESEIDMKDALKKLGMVEMFEETADFKKMLESSEQLQVSKAIHKAVIDVNEEGAEAAATSGYLISKKSGPLPFNIDRSFIYFIKNSDGQIFFMGRFTGA